jgi:hypothetical protein
MYYRASEEGTAENRQQPVTKILARKTGIDTDQYSYSYTLVERRGAAGHRYTPTRRTPRPLSFTRAFVQRRSRPSGPASARRSADRLG